MMLGVPLMQLVLFGYAINNDPKSLPAALRWRELDLHPLHGLGAGDTDYFRFDRRRSRKPRPTGC